jgi:hypothetical protein
MFLVLIAVQDIVRLLCEQKSQKIRWSQFYADYYFITINQWSHKDTANNLYITVEEIKDTNCFINFTSMVLTQQPFFGPL